MASELQDTFHKLCRKYHIPYNLTPEHPTQETLAQLVELHEYYKTNWAQLGLDYPEDLSKLYLQAMSKPCKEMTTHVRMRLNFIEHLRSLAPKKERKLVDIIPEALDRIIVDQRKLSTSPKMQEAIQNWIRRYSDRFKR